jgi:diguanylate cyclase (GGDEF)-like protein
VRLRKFRSNIALALVGAAGATAIGFGLTVAQWQLETAWSVHVERIDKDMQVKGERVGYRLQSIVDNVRSIAFIPGVRRVQSGNQLLSPLDHENVKQIVARLSAKFEGAQVYVVPANYQPSRLDPATGLLQAPAICFGCADAKTPTNKVEYSSPLPSQNMTSSQRQVMREQVEFFKTTFAKQDSFSGMDAPVINSGAVTIWLPAKKAGGKDVHTSAIVFSGPFYSSAGNFAGIVSAAIPMPAMVKIIPYGPYAVEGPQGNYRSSLLTQANAAPDWRPSFWNDKEVATTFASQYEITTSDPRGFWLLKAQYGAISFYQSPEFQLIKRYASWAIGVATLLTGIGMAWVLAARRKAQLLRHNATHDALTGLPNRVLLESYIQTALLDSARKNKTSIVLYLDLDRFKLVNDTLGHHVGDLVLQEAGRVISASIRANDILARLGGDEFVVLMRDCSDPADAMSVASRIIEHIARPMQIDGHTISIGTSIGISITLPDGQKADEILRCADLALFRAKSEERGSYRFYESAMDAERLRRRQLEADLRLALQNQEFVLHYQPIMNAATGSISSCEALLRWQHPERGMVPPLDFIYLAEELGLIGKIGEWVLNKACEDAMLMSDKIQMAVNVSVMQIKNAAFPLQVITALNKSGLPPNRLELELTESIMANGDETVLNNVKQLRSAGVCVALDDFGVGFSSFSCLKDFEFDRIKIDRSFLQNIDRSKEAAIFHAIANMGIELGVSTTAEGVETEEQLRTVLAQGCTEAQGYYFSKPKPLNELAVFVTEQTARVSQKGKSA